MPNTGVLTWIGDRGKGQAPHTARNIVHDVTDLSDLIAMGNQWSTLTDCNLMSAVVAQEVLGTTTPPGVDANIDIKGVVVMRNNDTGMKVEVVIPALNVSHIIAQPEGDRILPATVAAIAAHVTAATGVTHTGVYGYVLQTE